MTVDTGRGGGPVSTPFICHNPGERVEGDCPVPREGAGYYMRNVLVLSYFLRNWQA
jgi:hypothetical protein